MPFSLIPFLLLIIPVVEIGVFIAIGDQIGIFYTLMLILVTAVFGTILLRLEGFRVLGQIQAEINAGRMPTKELTNGVMILIAGVLLLTPGFVTDTIGFLLFLPPVRAAIQAFLAARIKAGAFRASTGAGNFSGFSRGPGMPPFDQKGPTCGKEGPVVDLDESAWTNESDPDSPWHKDDEGSDGSGGSGKKSG